VVRQKSAFAGFRFPPEVIVVAVRWYLRFNLSDRDLEELLVERGVEVDHVTVYQRVQRFTPCWPTRPGSASKPAQAPVETDARAATRVAAAFTELTHAI
jgi:transposase-like protein